MGAHWELKTSRPMSSARPIEPVSGELSNVEQTLYWVSGAPRFFNCLKTGGSRSDIQAGDWLRLSPAIPIARASGKRASWVSVGD